MLHIVFFSNLIFSSLDKLHGSIIDCLKFQEKMVKPIVLLTEEFNEFSDCNAMAFGMFARSAFGAKWVNTDWRVGALMIDADMFDWIIVFTKELRLDQVFVSLHRIYVG